jgi:2-C-methyl-D-erythritol 4-phosphate cytidylyltransferase/2-C-methyl-D-erythritol 2,4-cyclodiphosphate synthase
VETVQQSSADFVGIVVAGGRSSRFGGDVPKQFLDLGGRSVLERSVAALADRPGIRDVVVVVPRDEIAGDRLAGVSGIPRVRTIVPGGATRAASVRAGIEAAMDPEFLLVHDAARPLASAALVDAVIRATREHGAAVPAIPVPDTVKQVDASGRVSLTVDRSRLRLAQTPQGSRADWLREALDRAAGEGVEVTDEAMALELAGRRVVAVPGDPANRKLTTADDLDEARRNLGGGVDVRVGTGFDIHRRGGQGPLVLGGVTFAGETGLEGHSDADVVLHAAMDALLGATCLGDIGVLFPPEDKRWSGADSTGLAGRVAELLAREGWEIVNLDLTLLAERPKIRPHHVAMRRSIARCLEIAEERVGLKATTLERLGALGRGEGLACQAVALVRRRIDR